MTSYIEYKLEDGSAVLIESVEKDVVVRVSNKPDTPILSKLDLKQAFGSVRSSIKQVLSEFDDLHVEEAEIKFGLKSIGEAGIFAIGKVGGEINYEITLKWKKNAEKTSSTTQSVNYASKKLKQPTR